MLPRINMQLATFVTLTGIVIEGEGKFETEIISNYGFIKSALRNATVSVENTPPFFHTNVYEGVSSTYSLTCRGFSCKVYKITKYLSFRT